MSRRPAEDERALPAVSEFFAGLAEARCSGEYAQWGCMVSDAHAGVENSDPKVRGVLDQYHRELREAMYAALVTAERRGQLAPGAGPGASADLPALLAHGAGLRSRAGADAVSLRKTVAAALNPLGVRAAA
ncbi:hypothetical protein [Streptomyces sp. JHA26]|uniref:hypothetical protein n=1 Tax=Streptomyces sp. JHA26 TaxID=1917143 RepID=UPI00209A84EA|nr:hypothetical protein [Streptomyces sp. JHA26]